MHFFRFIYKDQEYVINADQVTFITADANKPDYCLVGFTDGHVLSIPGHVRNLWNYYQNFCNCYTFKYE